MALAICRAVALAIVSSRFEMAVCSGLRRAESATLADRIRSCVLYSASVDLRTSNEGESDANRTKLGLVLGRLCRCVPNAVCCWGCETSSPKAEAEVVAASAKQSG